MEEKENLEDEFAAFRKQVEAGPAESSQEVRLLKRVVRNLEKDLLQEKSKYQRYVSKKNEELKILMQQVRGI